MKRWSGMRRRQTVGTGHGLAKRVVPTRLLSALAAVGLGAALLVATEPAVAAAAGPTASGSAAHGALRVVNAVPGADLHVEGPSLPAAVDVQFRELSSYQRVAAGVASLTVSRAGLPAVPLTVDVPPGESVTVVITQTADRIGTVTTVDSFVAPGAGQITVRLLHVAGNVGPLRLVDERGTVLAGATEPGAVSSFVTVEATTGSFGVRRDGVTVDLLTVDGVSAQPGDALSVLVTGGVADAPVAATWIIDAHGTPVVPVGPIRTGSGDSDPADSDPADSDPADSDPADSDPAAIDPAAVDQPDRDWGGDPADGTRHTGAVVLLALLIAALAAVAAMVVAVFAEAAGGGIRRSRWISLVALAVACGLATAGCGTPAQHTSSTSSTSVVSSMSATSTSSPGIAPSASPGSATIPRPSHGGTDAGSPQPVGLLLPGAARPAPVVPVGLVGGDEQQGVRLPGAAGGELATIRDGTRIGWYSGGPAPGEPGSAVLAGHVSWNGAPAVFAGLAGLRAGASVVVLRDDGSELVFTVDRVDIYPKAALPQDEVHRPEPLPVLRLVTCDGPIADGTHRDNLVVSLSLAA